MLKNWRDDTKVLQYKKYSQRMLPGQDYEEPAEQAPFGVDKDMMKVLSKEDRFKFLDTPKSSNQMKGGKFQTLISVVDQ
ncbi:hypothetical protein RRG08_047950 [Elysia crispata]|uniref:Uncharacterized protein n=1 Tax=Elysia crispata TaxID=231223 RepID=A0AAE0XNV8_9GAST|nr:hypothetical protein RRG08_047950 [Elysia crispata]